MTKLLVAVRLLEFSDIGVRSREFSTASMPIIALSRSPYVNAAFSTLEINRFLADLTATFQRHQSVEH